MRLHLLFFLLCCTFGMLSAQPPVNDDCDGIIDLGVAPYCPDVSDPANASEIFTNLDATESDIGFGNNPTCFNGGTPQRDVWFSFVASDTIFDYTITVMAVEGPNGEAPILNPQVALYRGACAVNNLAELLCASADLGESMVALDADGLTPGITYYLRVNDYAATGAGNAGSFKLCVDVQDPIYVISDGGSNNCSGQLFDSGGPDGDYGNNENNVFSICPDDPSQCITFGLEYYNIEFGDFAVTDQLIFYDGPTNAQNAIISTLGGFDFVNFTGSASSGVCYEVQASSGCLTVQFISDGSNTFSGFAGSWECSAIACETNEPIEVTLGATAAEIETAITTPLAITTVTNIDCDNGAYGTFLASDNTDLGLTNGLLMTSGEADYAIGPNTNAGGFNNADLGLPGDEDLDVLSELFGDNTTSQDACIIELDVFANTNELSFEYIFGSEEYPEFIDEGFNDIFAFLVSGPGITGSVDLNGQENIAVLPGTNTFVEINSVNHLNNWEYYRNNENGLSVQYDGLTADFLGAKKSLTARATVEPCQTYHLKLAIADRGDGIYDSGVFISELSGGTPQIEVVFNSGIDYLIEQCTDQADEIIILLENPEDNDVTYNVILGGTAELDVDYLLDIPSQLTFTPGTNQVSFPIEVLNDLIDNEGTETITIQLTNDFGCGTVSLAEIEIELRDQFLVDINAGADTLVVCAGSGTQLMATGASDYFWTPIDIMDDPSINNPVASPQEDGWIYVEGTIGLDCSATDSIYITLVSPQVTLPQDSLAICQGESIPVSIANTTNGEGISWQPTTGVSDSTSADVILSPTESTTYLITVDIGAGCIDTDTLYVDVGAFDVPEVIQDTTICQNFSVTLANFTPPDAPTTVYQWSPAEAFDDPSLPVQTVFPDVTTTYELLSTSNNGACSEVSTVTVTVIPADVDILPDDAQICQGDEITLSAVTSTGLADGLSWSPSDSLSATTGLSVVANPTESTTYYATLDLGSCVVTDSVLVSVDSLPLDMSIMAEPFEEVYCVGELVTLVSPGYETVLYPNITHQWTGLGFETSDTLYNMVITTVDTFNYQRLTVNGACTRTEEILINVVTSEGVSFSPGDTLICAGESVQLMASSTNGGEISWTPSTGLSCDDCLTPIATPSSSTVYTPSFDIEGCLIEGSISIVVGQMPVINLIDDQTVCPGEVIPLFVGVPEPSATYSWTAANDPGFSSDEAELMITANQTDTYTLVASNDCFDAVTASVTITVAEQLILMDVGDDQTVCAGQNFDLMASVSGETNAEEAVWFYGGTNQSGQSTQFTATTTGFAVFNYNFISNGVTCSTTSDSVLVTVLEAPIISLIPDETFCQADVADISLNAAPAETGVTYSWSSPEDPSINNTTADIIVNPTSTTTYELIADNGSCSTSQSVTITVIEPATLTVSETLVFSPQNPSADLTATVTGGGGDETFIWTLDDAEIGDRSTIFGYTPDLSDLPGQAILTYSNACETLVDSVLLQVLDFRIPNIFSPNGDQLNDVFKPFYLGEFDVVEVFVFNRWGQKVFESTDPNNPGWDGQVNDKPAPSDVYLYQVRVGLGDEVIEESGQVTLIR